MFEMTSSDIRDTLRWCIENSIAAEMTYGEEAAERTVYPHEFVGPDRDSVLTWQTQGASGGGSAGTSQRTERGF